MGVVLVMVMGISASAVLAADIEKEGGVQAVGVTSDQAGCVVFKVGNLWFKISGNPEATVAATTLNHAMDSHQRVHVDGQSTVENDGSAMDKAIPVSRMYRIPVAE